VNNPFLKFSLALSVLLISIANGQAEESGKFRLISESEESVLRHLADWRFTTKAYQDEALRLMIKEANKVAQELGLREQLPISRSNLIEI